MMTLSTGIIPKVIAVLGLIVLTLGLVLQTFADTTGLYCFVIGAVLLLIFIGIRTAQLNQKERE